MIIFYNENGERLGKDYEVSWNFNQKRNKEGTGKIELTNYPAGAKYASLYKGKEKIKDVVITENSSNEKRVSTSIKTLESLFKNYRLPENWTGWNKKPLSFILSDAIYGFDYIQKSTLADFTDYLEKVNIGLNKIKDGDIHLDYREVDDGIRYYEQGQITFSFDCGEAVSQRYVRWVETAGEKVYVGIQSVSSNTPITDISQVDFSNIPILTINRGVETDSSFSGVPIASDKRYVAVRFILKYVNPDWINDFATHKVYNENNVLVDRTVRGFTPVIRAFEIITRKKTEFNVISSPVDMGELVEGIELSNITIWQAIQKIREKYPFDTRCYFKDGKVYFEFSKSLVKDKKKKAGYMLRAGDKITQHLNNTNIKELKTNTQKVNVLHCYGEGEKQQRLYVRIPETGTYDNMSTVEDVFTDTKIKTKKELKKRGLEVLKEKRKDDKPVFEVETLLPIRLFDEVSLVHPETNTIYEVVVEEENITYKENKLIQKFGIGGFLFNPIEALIKKEKYPDMRDYAMQPFGVTAYGKHRSIVLVWQGVEENYIVRWKEKGSSEYNYRNVKGLKTEIEGLKERGVYLFSVASTVNNMVSDYTCEIEAGTIHIYSKEGCIFLSSLDVKGDYENQTGTYQGLLYKWSGTEWELLNSVMPLNPVCYYDFADNPYSKSDIVYSLYDDIFTKDFYTIGHTDITTFNDRILFFDFDIKGDVYVEVFTRKNKAYNKYITGLSLSGCKGDYLYIPYQENYDDIIIGFYNKSKRVEIKKLVVYCDNFRNEVVYNYGSAFFTGFQMFNIDITKASGKTIFCKTQQQENINILCQVYENDKYLTEFSLKDFASIYIPKTKKTTKLFVYNQNKPIHIDFFSVWTENFKQVTLDKSGYGNHGKSTLFYKNGEFITSVGINSSFIIPKIEKDIICYCLIYNILSDKNSWLFFLKEGTGIKILDGKITYMVNNEIVSQEICKTNNDIQFIIMQSKNKIRFYTDNKFIAEKNYSFVPMEAIIGSKYLHEESAKIILKSCLIFDRFLTQQEILWLYHNPQYPIKNYTSADWAVCPQNPDNALANATPKYLGVVESVPVNSAVTITKGVRTGGWIANTGDWVLSGKTVDDWKVGICYKWNGITWIALEPAQDYVEEYQACLLHIFEIEELKQKTGHFGALFAKVLVAQDAFIKKLSSDIAFLKELTSKKAFVENLIANDSFIKKLTTDEAFLGNLIAKKLKIDNDEKNPNDFEVEINNDIGILAKNNGKEVFRIKKSGEAFLNDAELKNVTVSGKITPAKGLLNTWYWGKMTYTYQYEWFNVFKDRIGVGERLNIFGGGCFYNERKGGWQYAVVVFIERLTEDKFELNGYPMYNQGGYLTQATFQKNSGESFCSSFYIGW